jgi:hypothetical protein
MRYVGLASFVSLLHIVCSTDATAQLPSAEPAIPLESDEFVYPTPSRCRAIIKIPTNESEVSLRQTLQEENFQWTGPCKNGLAHGLGHFQRTGMLQYLTDADRTEYRWGVPITKVEIRADDHVYRSDAGLVRLINIGANMEPKWQPDSEDEVYILKPSVYFTDPTNRNATLIISANQKRCSTLSKSEMTTEQAAAYRGCRERNKFWTYGVEVSRIENRNLQTISTTFCPKPKSPVGCEPLWSETLSPHMETISQLMQGAEEENERLPALLTARFEPWEAQLLAMQATETQIARAPTPAASVNTSRLDPTGKTLCEHAGEEWTNLQASDDREKYPFLAYLRVGGNTRADLQVREHDLDFFRKCAASDEEFERKTKYIKSGIESDLDHLGVLCGGRLGNGGPRDRDFPFFNINAIRNYNCDELPAGFEEWFAKYKANALNALATAQQKLVESPSVSQQISDKDFACTAILDGINAKLVAAERNIPEESLVPRLEALMWALTESISSLRNQCPQSSDNTARIEAMGKSLVDAGGNCEAYSTTACVARLPIGIDTNSNPGVPDTAREIEPTTETAPVGTDTSDDFDFE